MALHAEKDSRSLIVAKFGGSSVRDARAMQNCGEVIKKFAAIKVAILSATYNTTNELEMLAAHAVGRAQTISGKIVSSDAATLKKHIEEKHFTLAQDLGVAQEIHDDLAKILHNLQATLAIIKDSADLAHYLKLHEMIYAVGELLSTTIFAAYLKKVFPSRKVVWLDSRQNIITDDHWTQASVDWPKTQERMAILKKELASDDTILYVAQGFIGATPAGDGTTLGREGSDLSAALYAAALSATELQIWTDVPGIASADPRRVKNVKYLPFLSYHQANLLSSLGAKVLHYKTLYPVMEQQIPVWVGQTTQPEKGTHITLNPHPAQGVLALQPVQDLGVGFMSLAQGKRLADLALRGLPNHLPPYLAMFSYNAKAMVLICHTADVERWMNFMREQQLAENEIIWGQVDGIYLLGNFDHARVCQIMAAYLQKKKINPHLGLHFPPQELGGLPEDLVWLPIDKNGGIFLLERSFHAAVLEDLHRLLIEEQKF